MACPVARAQEVRKIVGVLQALAPPSPYFHAFQNRLRELGWVEGQNILIELRWDPSPQRQRELAVEFVQMKVDVIYAPASPQVEAARLATDTIPIVFSAHGDPVGAGHVKGLSHPGGNITGLSNLLTELTSKGLDVLREAIPGTSLVGVVWDATAPAAIAAVKSLEGTAAKSGLRLYLAPVRSREEFDGELSRMAQVGVRAFLGVTSPLTFNARVQLSELALKYRLAAVFSSKDNAEAGALMSYGPDFEYLTRRAADYVDQILRGAKPSDLPVEQASKYLLVINSKTAAALGLAVPSSLLARADEVIE
jgi:putative ABC transport system substrate-binding protein